MHHGFSVFRKPSPPARLLKRRVSTKALPSTSNNHARGEPRCLLRWIKHLTRHLRTRRGRIRPKRHSTSLNSATAAGHVRWSLASLELLMPGGLRLLVPAGGQLSSIGSAVFGMPSAWSLSLRPAAQRSSGRPSPVVPSKTGGSQYFALPLQSSSCYQTRVSILSCGEPEARTLPPMSGETLTMAGAQCNCSLHHWRIPLIALTSSKANREFGTHVASSSTASSPSFPRGIPPCQIGANA